ncbi:hypothetical protein UFOVP117_213 [uncultured Caudovirales phage]|uniref:Uncharacterized protein n=1 Tax=uncultured Caudovirales phage TaxID=2100421 RepID=A0A6J5L9U7_9CAUD|nr:hypothetical protein UFOVP117_213 [uncultured Caudovirales phage]
MDTRDYILLGVMMGILISFVLYIGVWTPKEKMKGHAGRGECKCCTKN